MRHLIYIFIAACMLCACDKNESESVMPTFHGFTVTWRNMTTGARPAVGDTITITAVQRSLGDLIYNAKYSWQVETTIAGRDSAYKHSNTVVYDYDRSNPSLYYIVPAGNDGTLRVSFDGQYDFSANCNGMDGTRSNAPGYLGDITVSGNNLLGRATGNCRIPVNR